jgi:hypothetical protein
MVLGLRRATAESTTAKLRGPVYQAVRAFMTEFERRNRTLICRDLLDCDIRTEEGMAPHSPRRHRQGGHESPALWQFRNKRPERSAPYC